MSEQNQINVNHLHSIVLQEYENQNHGKFMYFDPDLRMTKACS